MNSNTIIRHMTISDIDNVVDIANKCFASPWTRADYVYSVDSEYDLGLVVVYNSVIVGFCIARMSFDTADITDVAVTPDMQRKGIGGMLISSLFEEGERLGVMNYMLEVRAGNEAAIALYSKYGFEKIGVRNNYYQSPAEDALLMSVQVH